MIFVVKWKDYEIVKKNIIHYFKRERDMRAKRYTRYIFFILSHEVYVKTSDV